MAFSFTLPELQAELRALGHDGLPDHVILTFLSQLSLPLPSPSLPSHSSSTSLDSSGYDTEASFCSTHPLSCGYGSSKEPNTCTGNGAPLSFVELVDGDSFEESTSLLKSIAELQPVELVDGVSVNSDAYRATELTHGEASSSNGNGRHACKRGNSSRTERVHTSLQHFGIYKPVRQEFGKQASPDKLIEHYWISVGEKHMRAMHSKSTKEEQLKGPPALDLQNATSASGTREGKSGYVSLVEKVEQCEDELQRLTLRLQAQRCKKPWFLEAARRPRVRQREKHDLDANGNSMQTSAPMLLSEPVCAHIEACTDRSQSSVIAVSIPQTFTEITAQESKTSSLDFVQECQEAPCENLAVESEPASPFSVPEHNELEESSRHQDQKDAMFCGLGHHQRDEPDPSVCSKSSSASYQHSRSSGDSRSNVSQQVCTRSSSRRRPCSTLQQQKRRGGKIDRVARFAEMQQLWKKDAFLVANEAGGKRKGIRSFHHHFSTLHSTRSY